MAGLTLTGFDRKTVEAIFAEIVADLHAKISPSLNTEAASLLGNFVGIFASKLGEAWEVLEALYRAGDRNGASGDPLDAIGALIGVPREAATKSTVLANVNVGAAFSQAPGTMIASVAGNPSARFVNVDTVASVGGGTLTGIRFEAESTGPTEAPSGTLTVIANPVSGWNSITNPLDAEIGKLIESDQAYRLRQIAELARVGSTTVDAIRADVLALDGVESALVLDNDTDTIDGNGLLPHSVEVILLSDSDDSELTEQIFQTIFRAKAGGINTNGLQLGFPEDSQGRAHEIRFTRPTEIDLYLEITIYSSEEYPGDAFVKETLASWGQENLTVGRDVIKQRIAAVCMAIDGIEDVDVTGIDNVTPTVTSANYSIGIREIARLDTSRIDLNVLPFTET